MTDTNIVLKNRDRKAFIAVPGQSFSSQRDWIKRANHRQNEKVEDVKLILSEALAPFTKGRNDA